MSRCISVVVLGASEITYFNYLIKNVLTLEITSRQAENTTNEIVNTPLRNCSFSLYYLTASQYEPLNTTDYSATALLS